MKVKQLNKINDKIDKEVFNFLLKSKPIDFGGLTSKHLFEIKSREFLDLLYSSDNIYAIFEGQDLLTIVFFQPSDHIKECSDEILLEFTYLNAAKFTSIVTMRAFHEVLKFAQEKFNKKCVTSNLERKNKKNKFITWLNRYDKKCEIFKENNILKIRWKYEKFN